MSDLRALIEAAKADGPSTAARAKVWTGVTTIVGDAAISATSAGGGSAAGSVGVAKMLVLGTLLGGSVTVGIGMAVVVVGKAPVAPRASIAAPAGSLSMPVRLPRPALTQAAVDEARTLPGANLAPALAAPKARFEAGKTAPLHASTSHATVGSASHATVGDTTESDTLAREASALGEARGALARRDALSALQIVRSLRALPGRQLVPEELAVEAQALRGLGLDDDAKAVETRLRARFPDSVLGR
jgi:hypothetical protein